MGHTARTSTVLLLAVLQLVGLSVQQQDSNFYYSQQQGRFTPSFQNPRNGFFGADTLRQSQSVSGLQNSAGSYQLSNLYLDDEQQQQQQQQQQLLRSPSPDNTQGFNNFQSSYSPFPQLPVRQPQSLSNPGADFFEISPRPFTLSPSGPSSPASSSSSIGGFQYTPRQPQQQQQPRAQQSSSANNFNNYPFGQQPTTTTSVASVFNHPPASATANTHHQSLSSSASALRFPNQPIESTANSNNLFGDQFRDESPVTPKSVYRSHPVQTNPVAQPPRTRTFASSHEQNHPTGVSIAPPSVTSEQFYNTRPNLPHKKEYSTSHEPTNPRTKGRLHPAYAAKTTTTTTEPPPTSTLRSTITPTSRRTRFNPYRSVVTPKSRVKSTTTTTTTTTPIPYEEGSIMRSQSQHYQSRPNNLIQRQPLFEQSDSQTNARQPFKKVVEKKRVINVPRFNSFPTKPSTTTTVATEPPTVEQLFPETDDYEYEDEPLAKEPQPPVKAIKAAPLRTFVEDDLAEEVDYVKSNANVLDTAKPTIISGDDVSPPKEIVPQVDEPVILTSNFYLPGNVKQESSPEETEEARSKPASNPSDYEYEYEYEDEAADSGSTSTSTTTLRTSTAEVQTAIDDSPLPTVFTNPETNISAINSLELYRESNAPPSNPIDDELEVLGEAVVSVVTTKSVINGTTQPEDIEFYDDDEAVTQEEQEKSNPTETSEDSEQSINPTEEVTSVRDADFESESSSDGLDPGSGNSSTENYLVVASVQTSRSVSGARYLPFPQVEQEEKKQALTELDSIEDDDESEMDSTKPYDPLLDNDSVDPTTVSTLKDLSTTEEDDTDVIEGATAEPSSESSSIEATPMSITEPLVTSSQSTESTIDKLDRVQSELLDRSGLLSGKFPILNEMSESTTTTTTEDPLVAATKAPPVVIRRFMPRTTSTARPHRKDKVSKPNFDEFFQDDLTAAILPPGFKPRSNSYRNKKVTASPSSTTSTSTEAAEELDESPEIPHRSANISRSFKSHPKVQETQLPIKKESAKMVDAPSSSSPPRGYTTKLPFVTVADNVNINQFLPPGYKPPKTTKKPQTAVAPPADFKPISDTSNKKPAAFIPVADNIASFLPPGYKPPADELPAEIPIAEDILSKLLPSGYNPSKITPKPKLDQPKIHKFSESDTAPKPTDASDVNETNIVDSILNKVQFKDVSALLPPGFKPDVVSTEATPIVEATTKAAGFKVVFPKGIGKRPGSGRVTTPAPVHAEGPGAPPITIRKGLRTTTEFTGWPSPPTTPFSIEKLLEQQRAQSIDISELLGGAQTSTSTTSTTTTTTTTTTVRPTQPGVCRSECNLAGTIKIVDGVKWSPELLDHNTEEWKNLAYEVEAQLNSVYNTSANLSRWYKSIRIDSFSKGSVLVDYFVELKEVPRQINTLEIKRMFHEALRVVPVSVVPLLPKDESTYDDEANSESLDVSADDDETKAPLKPKPTVKENMLLGKFILDPIATDFIVIPKAAPPIVEQVEPYSYIPQWAIAVIVIGLASLLFVIVFGVAVLVNRQRRSVKKQPVPLTADMLNELNKNHMGGVENYGQEDLYNQDDTWSDNKLAIKQKRFSNSMHGSSSNIYDSWRSQHRRSSVSPPDIHNYYDAHNYPSKAPSYPPPLPPDPYSLMDSHQMMMDHQQPMYPQRAYHQPQYPSHHNPQSMGLYTYNQQAPNNSNSRRYHSRDYDPEF